MEPIVELREKILAACTEPRTYALVSNLTKRELHAYEARFDIDVHWTNLVITDDQAKLVWIVESPYVPDWEARLLGTKEIYELPSVSVEGDAQDERTGEDPR